MADKLTKKRVAALIRTARWGQQSMIAYWQRCGVDVRMSSREIRSEIACHTHLSPETRKERLERVLRDAESYVMTEQAVGRLTEMYLTEEAAAARAVKADKARERRRVREQERAAEASEGRRA